MENYNEEKNKIVAIAFNRRRKKQVTVDLFYVEK